MVRKWYKMGNELKLEVEKISLADDELAVWYIGQCGFIIKHRGKIILIDPVLSDIFENGESICLYEPPFDKVDLIVDYVFCTHNHIDHLVQETIINLYASNKRIRFIVPKECKDTMLKWNINADNIVVARSKETINFDEDLVITPFGTAHPEYRKLDDGSECNLGYNINLSGFNLLHLGDTYLTDKLILDIKSISKPNLFLTPINGRDYFRERKGIIGNLNYREAAILTKEISADRVIPMHYDLVKGNTENPLCFVDELWRLDSSIKCNVPVLGECIILKTK